MGDSLSHLDDLLIWANTQNFDSISELTSLLINCEIVYWGEVLRSLRDLMIGKLDR